MARHSKDSLPSRPKGEVKKLKSMLRYLRPYKWEAAGALLAMTFTSGAVLGMGKAMHYLIDEGFGKNDGRLLDKAFIFLIGVTVLLALASYARFYLVTWIGERVVADIRRDVFKHITRMHVAFFETTRTGEILSRLTTDTTLIQTVVGSSLSVAVRNTLMMVGGIILLMSTSPKLTGYVFLMLPVVIVPILLLGRKVRFFGREAQNRVAELAAQAEENLNAMRTIHALTLEDYEEKQFDNRLGSILETAHERIRFRAMLTALVISLVFGSIVTVLWFGGKYVLDGQITPGDLSAFVFYAVVVAGAIGALSEVVADIQRAAGAAERLNELLEIEPALHAPAHSSLITAPHVSIGFENMSFSYPMRADMPVLQDVNLQVSTGEKIALVGPSGAGKSTIFQLLLRYYDPTQGRISMNGTDIRDLSFHELRGAIGLVPQDPIIFSGSIRDNIRLGRLEAADEAIMDAAQRAYVNEFANRLPQGLDTPVGEKGIQLSGGQRQRIAIARAIVRNPKLLLLDEATSALDSESEHLIQEAIAHMAEGRTTFIIAHRLSTVLSAHKIILMNHGRIEATGTHKELLSQSPLYARLAELQFRIDS